MDKLFSSASTLNWAQADQHPGRGAHQGHGKMNLPKIKLGSGAGEEKGSVKHRDTQKTWQLEV